MSRSMNTTLWQRTGVMLALALLATSAGNFRDVAAKGSGPVLNQQVIEVEGMRPVGLSPDGKYLAAADFGMNELCVYIVEPFATQSCASMEPLQSRLRLEDVSWSPDSTRLVMAERTFQQLRDGDIWVMDAMTGELTNVTDDGYEGDYPFGSDEIEGTFSFDVAPAWSPDGLSITYSRSLWADGEFRGNDIVTIALAGGEPKSLTMVDVDKPGVAYYKMSWTVDGQSLYYTATNTNPDDPWNGIYRYDKTDSSSQQMTGGSAETGPPALVQVSPSGDHLLFWYPALAARFGLSESLYWLLDTASGEVTELTPPGGNESGIGWISAACFSPDGQSLLLATRDTNPDFQLWETGIASGESTILVDSLPGAMIMEYSMIPSWTASGRIFVPSNIGAGMLLEVAPIAPPVAMTASPGPQATPSAQIGTTGYVAGQMLYVTGPGVPLHAAPAATAQAVLLLNEGDEVIALGSAEESDGVIWIPVQDQATRTIGFVRSEFLSEESP